MIMLKVYEIIKSIQLKKEKDVETDPTIIIKQAIENARPYLILEKVRVGGIQYRVPAPITETRSYMEGMRWIHQSARDDRNNPKWIARRKNPDALVRLPGRGDGALFGPQRASNRRHERLPRANFALARLQERQGVQREGRAGGGSELQRGGHRAAVLQVWSQECHHFLQDQADGFQLAGHRCGTTAGH